MPPCDIPHTQSAINTLIEQIKSLDDETKACMEHTGRYYEPVAAWLSDAGIFVSTVNPILIQDFGDDSLRTPKTYPGANDFFDSPPEVTAARNGWILSIPTGMWTVYAENL